jgi:hypothetical protein
MRCASCHLLYGEYADQDLVYADEDEDPAFEDHEAAAGSERRGEITAEFTDVVRERAASTDRRLC